MLVMQTRWLCFDLCRISKECSWTAKQQLPAYMFILYLNYRDPKEFQSRSRNSECPGLFRLPESATPRETNENEGEQMDGNGSWNKADLVEQSPCSLIKMFYYHVKDDYFTVVLGGDWLFAPNCCSRKSRQTFAVGLPLSKPFKRSERIWLCIQLQQLLVLSSF